MTERRKAQSLSQTDVAERMGVTKSRVSQIEITRSSPSRPHSHRAPASLDATATGHQSPKETHSSLHI
ncbi:helix-turn-helix domain-containing protein [Streptosporangium roseum]|uniref:helix-turn-helix domain-containing protein n=1 Tax=Streptosporangium roseum TaxID=2001 RepID=UPI0022AFDB19|nr:helix-turn-helix transcriptional regulator [Streptosporangium roseum]